MTITKLMLGVAAVALVLTLLALSMSKSRKSHKDALVKNPVISFIQFFCGVLFIVSGFVKAIDPMGTAFKMEQYFGEFESVFAGKSIAGIFPALSSMSVGFSVFMITLEIALGIMLVLGVWRKFTVWAFFLLLVFFTALTGFTYLTGYVPEGVNFFSFGQWGKYEATNMKVTDCGCFGDFLKLEPKVSFFKDVFLLIPGLLFLFFSQKIHQLFRPTTRGVVTLVGTAATLLYCFSNYAWDLPQVDFRPFKIGANIREQRAAEEEAASNVEVYAYRMTNKESGEVVELPIDKYLVDYKNYPTEKWDLEQLKTEPAIPSTKISEWDVSDLQGNDVTAMLLDFDKPALMIVAYKLYGTSSSSTVMRPDSVFVTDTLITAEGQELQRRLVDVKQKEVTVTEYQWDAEYLDKWKSISGTIKQLQDKGVLVYCVAAYSDPERITSFQKATGLNINFLLADDIALKTIIRSNPGPVLIKDGLILNKWHYKRFPTSADEIKLD